GRVGERHHQDPVDREPALEQQAQKQRRDGVGLACAGRSFDELGAAERQRERIEAFHPSSSMCSASSSGSKTRTASSAKQGPWSDGPRQSSRNGSSAANARPTYSSSASPRLPPARSWGMNSSRAVASARSSPSSSRRLA